MSFSIQLSSDLVSVEAGENTPLNLQVVNRGEEVDRFEVEIEGLDPEWTAVPVPIFTVNVGDTQTEKIIFRPGRASESLAGNYPFVVKVRSLNSGESRQAPGVLQIKPYNHLSMEIVPKKGAVSPLRSAEIFHASIMNLGNTEQTLQIFGSDPEDAFAFELAQEQVTVGPGQQKDVEIKATSTNARTFASPRLHVFTISARSIQSPSLVASSQAQIEQRPIITPAALLIALLVAVIFLGWFLSRPQPPAVDLLTLDPPQASYVEGDTVTVRWHSLHATGVTLTINNVPQAEPPSGQLTFKAEESGDVVVTASNGRTKSQEMSLSYVVTQPIRPPDPIVSTFEISPTEVTVGQSFLIKYKVENANRALLEPTGTVLDTNAESLQVKADQPGTFSYDIVAENAVNKATKSKRIRVRVIQASEAHIVYFDVSPTTVDPSIDNRVTITWQTSNAARVVLWFNGATTDLNAAQGSSTVTVDENTEFSLIVYDEKGLTTRSKRIYVKVKTPITVVPPTTSGQPTGTTGSTTSGTTGTTHPTPPTNTTGG